MADKLSTQIFRIDGKNCFIEFLNSSFQIGKVQFNMCQYDSNTKKQTQKLDFYMDFKDTLYLANILVSGRLDRTISQAVTAGTFEGKPISDFTSFYTHMNGTNLTGKPNKFAKMKERFPWLETGKSVSKQFKIQRSTKYKYMIRGEFYNGKISDTGLVMPDGQCKAFVQIPVTEQDAISLALVLQNEILAFRTQYYITFKDKLFSGQECNVFEADPNYGRSDNAPQQAPKAEFKPQPAEVPPAPEPTPIQEKLPTENSDSGIEPQKEIPTSAKESLTQAFIPSVGSLDETEQPSNETKTTTTTEQERLFVNVVMLTKGELKILNKGNIKAAVEAENKETKKKCILYFSEDSISKMGDTNWKALEAKSKYGISLKIKAEKKENNYLFVDKI